jgi:hypothetical protein
MLAEQHQQRIVEQARLPVGWTWPSWPPSWR